LGEIDLCHSIAMSFKPTSNSGHESFVRALSRHERVIRAYVRGAGISRPEDVDEIVQEVSLIAWQKFEQLEDVEEFPRWACVIARYRVLEFRRNRFRDRLVLNEKVFDLLLEEALDETEQHDARLRKLERCLDELPPASRKLVKAAYEPGASIDELARSAGKRANALYQQLWRLRQLLRKCVEDTMHNDTNPSAPSMLS
jgi:RNA polymerase sigma-70 factor (ECF subfamily)